jgi:hypothetical protein
VHVGANPVDWLVVVALEVLHQCSQLGVELQVFFFVFPHNQFIRDILFILAFFFYFEQIKTLPPNLQESEI